MKYSELKAEARKSLTGKWGTAALLTLVYTLISCVIAFILNLIPVIGGIASFVITLPMTYGFMVSMIKLRRGEEVKYTGFLEDGFSSFKQVWAVFGHMILKLIVPLVIVVVFIMLLAFGGAGATVGVVAGSKTATAGFSGIMIIGVIGYCAGCIYFTVRSLLYALSYFVLYDNPDKPAKEIVEESENLMRGHRWFYFWLPITFIGWMILAALSFYIGMLWLAPYIMITFVCFYEALAGKKVESPVVEAPKKDAKEAEVVKEETPVEEEKEVNPIQSDDDDEV